jgi:hypothetical protein
MAKSLAAIAAGTARAPVGTTSCAVTARTSGRRATGAAVVEPFPAGTSGAARAAVLSGDTSGTTVAAGAALAAQRLRFAAGPAGAPSLGGVDSAGVALAPGVADDWVNKGFRLGVSAAAGRRRRGGVDTGGAR